MDKKKILVVDDEAGVHRYAVGDDGVGVSPKAAIGLIERHIVPVRQQPSGGKTRNARADDGDGLARNNSGQDDLPRAPT